MNENPVISVGKCEVELLPDKKSYRGKPMSDKDKSTEIIGTLSQFRVTSSDELNLMVGLIEWPGYAPEVRALELIGGLKKHEDLEGRGGMSAVVARDGNWLLPLRALKFSPSKGYFTLQGASEEELDDLLGHSLRDFLSELGAIRFGSRQEIDGETSKVANQLAMVVAPGNVEAIAVAYTATRPLAVIKDFGLGV